MDRAAESAPDFVVLGELFGLPIFSYVRHPRYLGWAEDLLARGIDISSQFAYNEIGIRYTVYRLGGVLVVFP